MQKNISKCDRMARFIVAIILVALYGTNVISGTLGVIALVVVAVMVVTAAVSFCPLYKIIGMNPCGESKCCGGCGSDNENNKEDKAE